MATRQSIAMVAERATKYKVEDGVLLCRCPRCRRHLPLETDFHQASGRANGYTSWCKSCGNEYRRLHR